jgi:predicted dehydrogenase
MTDKKSDLTRRKFMQGTAAVAAGAALSGAARSANASSYKRILPQTVMGANEKIRTGHIGVGGMGERNLQFCLQRKDIQPIAVCDLREERRGLAADMTQYSGHEYARPSEHTYFEEVIANKDVDAVVIVTPDHWHAVPTIMASQAGKDIWTEKPLATTVGEGRAVVDEIERSGVVFQGGNFQRSGVHFQEVVQMIREGYIGKVSRVETWIHDQSKLEGIGAPPDSDVPEGVDWDRYLGWTPKVPFNKNRFVYDFRWFLNYSGGKMTDWGAHLIDIVLWAMGEDKAPRTVTAQGGKFVLTDNRTTPDTLDVLYEFDDYILSFSNRVWAPVTAGNRYGIWFHGTLGSMRVDRTGYEVFPFKANGDIEKKMVTGVKEGDMNNAHWQNFVDCVRSRERCICDAPIIHNTSTVCHIGTAAYVAGGKLAWDNDKELFVGGDKKAVKAGNKFAHRRYENGWSLKAPFHKDLRA